MATDNPTDHAVLRAAVSRLAERRGSVLRNLGSAVVDPVTVRRFREALGLDPDPALGVPLMLMAHLFRDDADVSRDVLPHETIDDALRNPVNGGTEVHFTRALRVGESVTAERLLADAYVREGKQGPLGIVVTESRYRDQAGGELARVRLTMIYRESTA